jgi:hypothetical protein
VSSERMAMDICFCHEVPLAPWLQQRPTQEVAVLEPTPTMNVLLYIYICNLFCFALCVNK